VGKCFFDAQPKLVGGVTQCAEFGLQVHRGATGAVTGSIIVVCDKATGDVKFTSKSITGLVIRGNSASFQAPGVVIGVPANASATANVTVTDNEDVNDMFGVTLKAGSKVLCNGSNAVKGDTEVLVGHNTDPDVAAGANRLAVERLIAATPSTTSRGAWPLLLALTLGAGGFALRRRRATTR
jgi:hypothetical protein